MKYCFLIAITGILFLACGNNNADSSDNDVDTIMGEKETYLWQSAINDSTSVLEMSKIMVSGIDSLRPESLIQYLNEIYPNVQLEYIKSSNDTLYLKIPAATYLTQQMGSTGPQLYFSTVVYNLTELPGIKHINVDFEEGDHAGPGVFSREDFQVNK